MNGWNGLPGIAGMTGAVSPFSMGNFGAGPAPYMTPVGGTEVMRSMASIAPLGANYSPLELSGLRGITAPGSNGWFGIDGLGKNLDTLKMGVGLAGGIANVWSGLQQQKLAKQSFNHQKGIMDTNLANQIRSFNLQLDDKLRSRQVVEGSSDADREAARARWAARDERRG